MILEDSEGIETLLNLVSIEWNGGASVMQRAESY